MKSAQEFAAEARTLLAQCRFGILSTISVAEAGFPFGSVAPFDVDDEARLTIYISFIAEHYRNLKQDARASLTITDPFGGHDPHAHARATILTRFEVVPEEDRAEVQARYEARFPNSVDYSLAHNFVFMRGTSLRVRWIGGFGEIRWIDGENFRLARPDPLAGIAAGVIEHMNLDHRDSLREYVRAFSEVAAEGRECRMTGITSRGFIVELLSPQGSEVVPISFPEPVTPESVRGAMIALLQQARAKR